MRQSEASASNYALNKDAIQRKLTPHLQTITIYKQTNPTLLTRLDLNKSK